MRRLDPGEGEIPVLRSIAVKEGRACPSHRRGRWTVPPTVPPPSVIAVFHGESLPLFHHPPSLPLILINTLKLKKKGKIPFGALKSKV